MMFMRRRVAREASAGGLVLWSACASMPLSSGELACLDAFAFTDFDFPAPLPAP
jgi:hypothetical protein